VTAEHVLALAGDHRYAPGLIVATASALVGLASVEELTVLIFDEGLTRADRRMIELVVRRATCPATVTFATGFSALGVDVPTGGHITTASYARLLVPEAAPQASRAIYLDADVMVIGDVTHLYRFPFGDATVAGSLDRTVPTVQAGLDYSYRALGLGPSAPYLNAGVLAMNLDRWRSGDITGRVLAYLDAWRDQVIFHDQDGINAVCATTTVVLEPYWNYQQRIEAILAGDGRSWYRRLRPDPVARDALAAARIIHFSDAKPWQFPGWLFLNGVSRRAHARWWRFALAATSLPVRFRVAMLARALSLVPYVVGRKLWRVWAARSRQTPATAAGE
jgi:lipopolysaccharide biosynthesis glycosyltransferase